MKKNLVKTAIVTSALGLTLSIAAPTALAVKTEPAGSKATSQVDDTFFSVNPPVDELFTLGLSAAEISALMDMKSTGITLKDGIAYDKDGRQLDAAERGRLTWAVKAIKAGYKKLPRGVRRILDAAGVANVLRFIEHYTGALEDAIYDAIYKQTRNKFFAWSVSKTIMWVIF